MCRRTLPHQAPLRVQPPQRQAHRWLRARPGTARQRRDRADGAADGGPAGRVRPPEQIRIIMKQKLQSLKNFLKDRKDQQATPLEVDSFFLLLLAPPPPPPQQSVPALEERHSVSAEGISERLQRELKSCQDVQAVERRCHELQDEFERKQRKEKQLINSSSHNIVQTLYLIKQLIAFCQIRLSSLDSLMRASVSIRATISTFLHSLSLFRTKALLRKKIKALTKLRERLRSLKQLDKDFSLKQLPDRLQILNKHYQHMPKTIIQKAATCRHRIRLDLSAELLVQTFLKPRGQELFLLESFFILDRGSSEGWNETLSQFGVSCLHFIVVKGELVLPSDSKVLCRASDSTKIITQLQLKQSEGVQAAKFIKNLKQAQANLSNMKRKVNRVFQKVHSHQACRFAGQLASFKNFVSGCYEGTSKELKHIKDAVQKIQYKFSGQARRPFQEILAAI